MIMNLYVMFCIASMTSINISFLPETHGYLIVISNLVVLIAYDFGHYV